jgi:hypothetical protein
VTGIPSEAAGADDAGAWTPPRPGAVVGVTGHQDIPEAAAASVRAGIEAALRAQPRPVTALTSLAAGADQLFARLALAHGAALTVVLPSEGYEATFAARPAALAGYAELRALAAGTVRLGHPSPTEAAFEAAGRWIADHCDLLVAVWDGQPARGTGGTGDIVRYALDRAVPVVVVWKPGVLRQ